MSSKNVIEIWMGRYIILTFFDQEKKEWLAEFENNTIEGLIGRGDQPVKAIKNLCDNFLSWDFTKENPNARCD